MVECCPLKREHLSKPGQRRTCHFQLGDFWMLIPQDHEASFRFPALWMFIRWLPRQNPSHGHVPWLWNLLFFHELWKSPLPGSIWRTHDFLLHPFLLLLYVAKLYSQTRLRPCLHGTHPLQTQGWRFEKPWFLDQPLAFPMRLFSLSFQFLLSIKLPPRLVVFLFLNREHVVFVWFDLSCSLSPLRRYPDSFSWNLFARTLQRVALLGPTSLSRRHRELVHSTTHVQIGWTPDSRDGTFLVSSLVGCAQVLLDTNSCCGHTKQFDQAFRRSVVDEQESELVQSRRPVCASDGSHNRCPFGLVAGLLSIANASFKQWTHLCAIVFVVMVNRCLQSSEPFDAQQLWDTGGFDDVGTEPSVRCLHPYERVRTCRRPISQFKRHCSSRFHVDFHLEL